MRPRKTLTSKEKEEVLAILSAGCSRAAAARCVRCTPQTLRQAILNHPQFANDVAKAESGTEIFYLTKIRKAATKEQYWRAAAWILERRLPERYGIKKADILSAEQVQNFMQTCLQIIAEEVSDKEQRDTILQRLSAELEEQ